MCGLEISDLSFCEVAVEKDLEIKGGLSVPKNLKNLNLSLFFKKFLNSQFVDYTREQLSSEPEYVVEKLENKTTGESGYVVSSKDGKMQIATLVGQNSNSTFALSVSHSSS